MDFPQWLAASRLRVEAVLREALAARLPMSTPGPARRGDAILHEAMAYGLLGGGKRVRALLAIAAGETVDADASWCAQVGAFTRFLSFMTICLAWTMTRCVGASRPSM
jgi:farnesyl diphosphate synthase